MSNVEGKLINYKSSKKSNEELEREIEELEKGNVPQEEEEVQEEKPKAKAKDQPEQEEEKLSAEEENWKQRYSKLRSYNSKMKNELEARIKALEGKQEVSPPASKEDLKKWMETNPEVASVVRALAQEEARGMFEEHNTTLEEFKQAKEEASLQSHLQKIRKAHPDFDELQESDDFHEWVGQQSDKIQDLIYDNAEDPDAVILILKTYKAEKNKPIEEKKKSKDAARSVSSSKSDTSAKGEKKIWKESEIDSLPPHIFEKHMEDIEAAAREGRIEYDGRKKRNYKAAM